MEKNEIKWKKLSKMDKNTIEPLFLTRIKAHMTYFSWDGDNWG